MSGPRILHAPTDVGGNAFGLSRAERELGLHSDVVVLNAGPFGYGYDIDLAVDGPLWRRLSRRLSFLRDAVDRYDIFHFNFGHTLFSIHRVGRVIDELAWLRRRDKTILMTFQGCDVRPFSECFCRNRSCARNAVYRQPAAARALRYANRVFYVNPDLGQWLPGATFVPYASVDAAAIVPSARAQEPGELIVAHAPTDRAVKGTAHVIEAVAQLRREGVAIRLDLIEGVTRDRVMERLAMADVLVDQLLIGWYGALAVEAMALGRPVVAHVAEDGDPYGDELPIVRATPVTLADRLRELAGDPPRRQELGLASRRFAERVHDPRVIAATILQGLAPLPGPGDLADCR